MLNLLQIDDHWGDTSTRIHEKYVMTQNEKIQTGKDGLFRLDIIQKNSDWISFQ